MDCIKHHLVQTLQTKFLVRIRIYFILGFTLKVIEFSIGAHVNKKHADYVQDFVCFILLCKYVFSNMAMNTQNVELPRMVYGGIRYMVVYGGIYAE